jgi:hypothetical protein
MTHRDLPWYRDTIVEYDDALFPEGILVSSREAARIIGIGKTTASEFLQWVREVWLGEEVVVELNAMTAKPVGETAAVIEGSKKETWIADGLVHTDLGTDYGVFSLTRRDFEAFRKDYSRLWAGKALNQSQMAYKYSFPSAHAVDTFRRIHGLRQTSIPHTDEEIATLGVDGAVAETLASHRQSYMLKLQERERLEERRDAERWRTLELSIQGIIAGMGQLEAPTPADLNSLIQTASQPYAVMISLSDLHLGRLAHDADGKVIWNRKEAKRVAITAVRDLLKQTLVLGRPDEIMLLVASDGVHIDGPQMSTTGGTPQGEQSEGTYREMVEDYLSLLQEVIGICRAISSTRLLVVEGNHDRVTSMMIGLMLNQLYAGDTRVNVETQRGSGLIQINYGENTLAFLHGEFLKRPGDLFKILLATADNTGLPLMRNRLTWGGHLHHERVEDLGGIKHHTLTSLAPNDEWHRRSFWVGATLEAQAFVIRRSGGKGAVFYSDMKEVSA